MKKKDTVRAVMDAAVYRLPVIWRRIKAVVALYFYRRCLRKSRLLLPDGVSIIRHVGGKIAFAVGMCPSWTHGLEIKNIDILYKIKFI